MFMCGGECMEKKTTVKIIQWLCFLSPDTKNETSILQYVFDVTLAHTHWFESYMMAANV